MHIITPVSRPAYLSLIEPSIALGSALFDLTWWTVYDSLHVPADLCNFKAETRRRWRQISLSAADPLSAVGNAQNNAALDQIKDPNAWCFFLSDDNTMHPEFYPRLSRAITAQPNKRAFIFHQQVHPTGVRPAHLATVKKEFIDLAQFVLRRDLIGTCRFDLPVYQSDGLLVEAIYNSHPTDFALLDSILCYYNRLKW